MLPVLAGAGVLAVWVREGGCGGCHGAGRLHHQKVLRAVCEWTPSNHSRNEPGPIIAVHRKS